MVVYDRVGVDAAVYEAESFAMFCEVAGGGCDGARKEGGDGDDERLLKYMVKNLDTWVEDVI